MSIDETAAHKPRRERSTRYPGVPLQECVAFCEHMDSRGLDGLSAPEIATAMGYKNIKTNTFSAPLSAARQFGLLALSGDGYSLTPLARSILHPVEPADLPRLRRKALLESPLYSELATRLGGKRVPDVTILGNILYHHHQIIAKAKDVAAESFVDSARFAGALGDDQILRLEGSEPIPTPAAEIAQSTSTTPLAPAVAPRRREPRQPEVRLDIRLWDEDAGKVIRVRAPESITPASFDRFLQTLRLLIRIEEPDAETTEVD
ncbi:hypothetical protein EP7_000746 [Isosphaeraceae bacterium EP7]